MQSTLQLAHQGQVVGVSGKGWVAKIGCRVLRTCQSVYLFSTENKARPHLLSQLVAVGLPFIFTILGAYNVRIQEPINGLVVGQCNTTRGPLSPPTSFYWELLEGPF